LRADVGYTNKETKFTKDLKAKVRYSVNEVTAAGVANTSSATTTPHFDLGEDKWVTGIFFRTAAFDSANPNAGASSAPVKSDFVQTGTVQDQITKYNSTKKACVATPFPTASSASTTPSTGTTTNTCQSGHVDYPKCETCATGKSGSNCETCDNGKTGANCDTDKPKTCDSAVSVAMTSTAAIVALGAFAF